MKSHVKMSEETILVDPDNRIILYASKVASLV